MKNKRCILAASFGTTHRDTCEKNLGAIEEALAEAFPDWQVRRAFTSGMVRRRLLERDGVQVDSVEQAMDRLAAEGFQQVVCQPTHVINGAEYEGVRRAVEAFAHRFDRIALGTPLLTGTGDYRALAKILMEEYPLEPDEVLCLMGHGTAHHADAAYAALDSHLRYLGREDMRVGTVEGFPDLPALLEQVGKTGAGGVLLAPLMVVAGDHAVNDLAGGEDSWKAAFEAAGYRVRCCLRGLGELPGVRALYVEHARRAMGES